MQLCSHGSLKQFLRENKKHFHGMDDNDLSEAPGTSRRLMATGSGGISINILNLISWSLDVAKGMEFVSGQNVSNFNYYYDSLIFFSCFWITFSNF